MATDASVHAPGGGGGKGGKGGMGSRGGSGGGGGGAFLRAHVSRGMTGAFASPLVLPRALKPTSVFFADRASSTLGPCVFACLSTYFAFQIEYTSMGRSPQSRVMMAPSSQLSSRTAPRHCSWPSSLRPSVSCNTTRPPRKQSVCV